MADLSTSLGEQNRDRIVVNEVDELREWATKFDVTAEQLKDAVRAVGDRAADVEMHLKGTHATTNADQEARVDAKTSR